MAANKVLFLDIDGVLNSQRDMYDEKKVKKKKNNGWTLEDNLDARNLFWVGLFCRLTKVKVVMSSSWRGLWDKGMKTNDRVLGPTKKLRRWGIKIEDRTSLGLSKLKKEHPYDKSLVGSYTSKCNRGYYRGTQILEYIEKHNLSFQDILIFDDDICDIICYSELKPRIVQSYFYKNGFGLKQFKKAMKLMRG